MRKGWNWQPEVLLDARSARLVWRHTLLGLAKRRFTLRLPLGTSRNKEGKLERLFRHLLSPFARG